MSDKLQIGQLYYCPAHFICLFSSLDVVLALPGQQMADAVNIPIYKPLGERNWLIYFVQERINYLGIEEKFYVFCQGTPFLVLDQYIEHSCSYYRVIIESKIGWIIEGKENDYKLISQHDSI